MNGTNQQKRPWDGKGWIACSRGFSLLELLIVLAIFGVLLGAMFTSLAQNQKIASISRDENEMQQNLQDALALMESEIRMAGFPTASYFARDYLLQPSTYKNLVAQGLMEIQPKSLKFQGDINGDGEVEYVHYYLSGASAPYVLNRFGGKLDRNDGSLPSGSPQKVAEQVEDLQFHYFDANGIETFLLSNTKAIEARLTLRTKAVDPSTREYRTASQLIRVCPPNL
jgi:type II secretion system protein J